MRPTYERRLKAGLCIYCGKNPFIFGTKWCAECREKRRMIQKNYVDTNRKDHKCIACGKPLPDGWKRRFCEEHRVKRNAYHNERIHLIRVGKWKPGQNDIYEEDLKFMKGEE